MEFQKKLGRIYAKDGKNLLAEILFPDTMPGICDICRVFVDDSLRGQGIAGQLMELAAAEIAAAGKKAKTSCPYAKNWVEKHPEQAAPLQWQEAELHAQLADMGIRRDDTVMVHSSLRSLGPVVGGAEGLIRILRSYLNDGLLLIPTHTWGNVNAEHPYYNAAEDLPCIGQLPQIAAFHPDGVRSLHPTHSVAAFGRRAKEYVQGEELLKSPAPPEGCCGRLYQENAKILLVGVSQNRNTYLHAVEEMIGVPDRLGEQPYLVHGTDGKGYTWERPMYPHHNSKSRDISQFYPKYLPALLQYDAVKIGQLGSARTEVCDARRCADVMRQIWQKAEGDIGLGDTPLPEEIYQNLNPV